jgi:uncharacterized membrane protein YkvA (DUF1232 family)
MIFVTRAIRLAINIGRNIVNTGVLAVRGLVAEEISPKTKIGLVMAMIYFSAPLDVFPELILGQLGLIDDAFVIVSALHQLLNVENCHVIVRLWPGSEADLLQVKCMVAAAAGFFHRWIKPVTARAIAIAFRIRPR